MILYREERGRGEGVREEKEEGRGEGRELEREREEEEKGEGWGRKEARRGLYYIFQLSRIATINFGVELELEAGP